MSDSSSNPTLEKILEIICPQIKHAKCSHKDDEGRWDYWRADSGLCWCNGCGKCMNGRWEYEHGFQDWKPNYYKSRGF